MTMSLLIGLAWKSALCTALTLAALRVFRGRSACERSRLAHAGIVAVLLVPLAPTIIPPVEIAPPAAMTEVVKYVPLANLPATAPEADAASVAAFTISAGDPVSLLPLALLLPSLVLLLLTALALARLQRLRGGARVLIDPQWLTALARAQERIGAKNGTALLVSDELASPISWGLLRPVILLDPKAAADASQAEAVIAHELAHVAHLDWAKLLLSRIACALFWFNPLVWMLARRSHELREEAADDAVLRGPVSGPQYAELLVGVARHENRAMLLAANGVAPSPGSLSRRVVRVLDPSCRRSRAGTGWTLACSGGALATATALAIVTIAGPAREAAVAAPPTYLSPVASTASGATRSPEAKRQLAQAATATAPAGEAMAAPGQSLESPVLTEALMLAQASTATAPAREAMAAPRQSPESPVLTKALIFAARKGHQETVARLLALGVSPDAALPGDGTALIAAARAGHRGIAQLLLASGATIDLGVRGDANPLTAAARVGRKDMVAFLISRGAAVNAAVAGDGTPLTAAASAGKADIVRLLLEHGAPVDQAVPDDETALIRASHRGHEEVVTMLLARGADPNWNAWGRTALSMARRAGHDRVETLLKEAGATR